VFVPPPHKPLPRFVFCSYYGLIYHRVGSRSKFTVYYHRHWVSYTAKRYLLALQYECCSPVDLTVFPFPILCRPRQTATDAFGRSPTRCVRLMYFVKSLPVVPLCSLHTVGRRYIISHMPHGSFGGARRSCRGRG